MNSILASAYQLAMVLLYVILSAILIYRRLFRRWLTLSCGFFVAYLVGSYVFFGASHLPLSDEILAELPLILLSFGTTACLGYALLRQFTAAQTLGLVLSFTIIVLTLCFLAGGISPESLRAWIALASLMTLVLGLIALLGYAMTRDDWGGGQRVGAVLLFLALTPAVLVVVELTIGYESISQLVSERPAWLPRRWH